MQDKMLAAIDAAIQHDGYREPVHRTDLANTGRVFAQAPDGFETACALSYGFFSDNCTISLWGEEVAGLIDEAGIQNRFSEVTRVSWQVVVIDGIEYRAESREGEHAIVYHYLKYDEWDKIEGLLALIRRSCARPEASASTNQRASGRKRLALRCRRR